MKSNNANLDILKIFKECIPIFAVLADEERQKIILILAEESNGVNVKTITERLTLSRPAVSHHLKVLKQNGLIDVEKKSTENYYFLTLKSSVEKLKSIISLIEANCELK